MMAPTTTTAYTQRFQAMRKPAISPKPFLGPLVEAAFERHQAIQVDHDGRQRQVEGEHRRQPEDYVGAAEFRRDAHPARTDDAEDLRQDEVAQSEFLAESGFFFHGSIIMP